jgi:hypothetical protein
MKRAPTEGPKEAAMTSQTIAHDVPSFRTHSRLALLRDLFVVALCAAIVGGFLAHAWRPPEPTLSAAASPIEVQCRS